MSNKCRYHARTPGRSRLPTLVSTIASASVSTSIAGVRHWSPSSSMNGVHLFTGCSSTGSNCSSPSSPLPGTSRRRPRRTGTARCRATPIARRPRPARTATSARTSLSANYECRRLAGISAGVRHHTHRKEMGSSAIEIAVVGRTPPPAMTPADNRYARQRFEVGRPEHSYLQRISLSVQFFQKKRCCRTVTGGTPLLSSSVSIRSGFATIRQLTRLMPDRRLPRCWESAPLIENANLSFSPSSVSLFAPVEGTVLSGSHSATVHVRVFRPLDIEAASSSISQCCSGHQSCASARLEK